MKPCLKHRRAFRVFHNLPRQNAGASLKHQVRRQQRINAVHLPRQRCPGLIEALVLECPGLAPGSIFPGRNAGASLKPHHAHKVRMHPGIFPGGNAGASLKREGRRNDPRALPQIFPGRNAGASLKRHACRSRDPQQRVIFPSRNAGASLKRGGIGGEGRDGTRIFPGRNAGASLKRDRWRGFLVCFADLPRQKCRGLIEASGAGNRC